MKEQSIIRKTADLAMMEDHGENFAQDIRELISVASKLSDARPQEEIKPSDSKNYLSLRKDSVKQCMDKQELLSLAPKVKDGYIFIPKLMETE